MTIADLFIAIHHDKKDDIRSILTKNPNLIEQTLFRENKDEDKMYSSQFSSSCPDFKNYHPSYLKETPLIYAARVGNEDICNILLDEFNADINAVNIHGNNALMTAINIASDKNLNIALSLLDRKELDINWVNHGKYDALSVFARNTGLRYARIANYHLTSMVVQKVIDRLLELNFDINKVHKESQKNVLLLACLAGNWILVFYFILNGADYSYECEFLGIKHSMILDLCYNLYLPPKVKNEILNNIDIYCKITNYKYGKIERPEHLYLDMLTGEPEQFDEERFGS